VKMAGGGALERAVNTEEKELAAVAKKPENRSTTHIRIKKSLKFQLERWMKNLLASHCKTYSQAIKKLLESSGAGA
jgi:hypothetical protein